MMSNFTKIFFGLLNMGMLCQYGLGQAPRRELQATMNTLRPLKDGPYTQYYCEENIWHLCKRFREMKLDSNIKCYAVFISNNYRTIMLWSQKVGRGNFVMWDYHVIAVCGNKSTGYVVLDFDTTLPFPVSFEEYAQTAIRPQSEATLNPRNKRYFRVISSKDYVKYFSSDRRHMKPRGYWMQPPPRYPAIVQSRSDPHNLDRFISMNSQVGYGEVLNCQDFVAKFTVN